MSMIGYIGYEPDSTAQQVFYAVCYISVSVIYQYLLYLLYISISGGDRIHKGTQLHLMAVVTRLLTSLQVLLVTTLTGHSDFQEVGQSNTPHTSTSCAIFPNDKLPLFIPREIELPNPALKKALPGLCCVISTLLESSSGSVLS